MSLCSFWMWLRGYKAEWDTVACRARRRRNLYYNARTHARTHKHIETLVITEGNRLEHTHGNMGSGARAAAPEMFMGDRHMIASAIPCKSEDSARRLHKQQYPIIRCHDMISHRGFNRASGPRKLSCSSGERMACFQDHLWPRCTRGWVNTWKRSGDYRTDGWVFCLPHHASVWSNS